MIVYYTPPDSTTLWATRGRAGLARVGQLQPEGASRSRHEFCDLAAYPLIDTQEALLVVETEHTARPRSVRVLVGRPWLSASALL